MLCLCIVGGWLINNNDPLINDTVRTGNINWLTPPLKKVVPNENYSDFALLSTTEVFSLFYSVI